MVINLNITNNLETKILFPEKNFEITLLKTHVIKLPHEIY